MACHADRTRTPEKRTRIGHAVSGCRWRAASRPAVELGVDHQIPPRALGCAERPICSASQAGIWTPRVNIHTDLEDPAEVPPGDPADVRPVATSVVRRGWGSSVFGIVAEGHVRRRPSDIVRVGLAAAVVALAAFGATDVTRIEAAVFDVFASLPSGLEPVWEVLYLLTPIVAGVLLVTALVARRHGLLATQLVAAGVAWAVGALLSAVVDVPESLSDAARALHGHTPDFPVVLLAAGAAGCGPRGRT